MANYPAHSQKQPLSHRPDPQPKTSHDTEKKPIPSPTQPTHPRKNEKWATFTFISPNIRKVTNLFKHAGVKIAFRGKNTLTRLVKTTNTTRTPAHNKPGIYQLKCNTCNLSYIDQTSRNLKTRYHEHIRYIKNNNPQSAYAQHILNNRHDFKRTQ